MKKLLLQRIYIFIVIIFWGCLRINTIEQFNKSPEIIFNDSITESIIKDSIKISLKHSQKFYNITLKIDDLNNNLVSLNYKLLSGRGNLYQDNQKLEGNSISLNSKNAVTVSYEPSELGNQYLQFIAADKFGEEAIVSFELTAFDNRPPIASFKVITPDYPIDPLERVIDASGSYDQDKSFGGGIVKFEYTVLGKTILIEKNAIPVIFPTVGNYAISLRVLDNDGMWSESVTDIVEVE